MPALLPAHTESAVRTVVWAADAHAAEIERCRELLDKALAGLASLTLAACPNPTAAFAPMLEKVDASAGKKASELSSTHTTAHSPTHS